jgi:hypothetical protein
LLKKKGKKKKTPQKISLFTDVTSKYGDLAFQVGGVSDETVKYDREFCGTST